MKTLFRMLALALACLLPAAVSLAEEDTVTISVEEYERLQKYQRLEEALSLIETQYLWEYDENVLLEGAMQGLLGALGDDYTFYYTPADMSEETESVTGEYAGLGIEVFANPNDLTITIKRVFYGGPAQQAGLRPSDKIVQVNGQDVTAYELNDAVSIMRGDPGTEVTLTILRGTESFEVTCERAIVETEIMDYRMVGDDIAYLRLYYFEGNALEQLDNSIAYFQEQGVRALVLDLRENPGGFMDMAVDIADRFLDDALVLSTEDKYGRRIEFYAEDGCWDVPIAVLIDEYTASSAEILAAALRDNGAAKLVGTTSFGKGIVQTVYTFAEDGAGMQLTSQYWLTPNDACIHEVGLEPDVEVMLAEDAIDENFQFVPENDNQLQAAVELLEATLAEEEAAA